MALVADLWGKSAAEVARDVIRARVPPQVCAYCGCKVRNHSAAGMEDMSGVSVLCRKCQKDLDLVGP